LTGCLTVLLAVNEMLIVIKAGNDRAFEFMISMAITRRLSRMQFIIQNGRRKPNQWAT